jgi:hypothetical protein
LDLMTNWVFSVSQQRAFPFYTCCWEETCNKLAHNQRDSQTQSGNEKIHTNSDAQEWVLETKQNEPLMRRCYYTHWETSKARTSGILWLGRKDDSTTIMIRRQRLHEREMKSFEECDPR